MNLATQNVCKEEIAEKEIKCGVDSPSAFTISDKALEKLSRGKAVVGEYAAKEGIITGIEEKWLAGERCLEQNHAKTWKYSNQHIDELEERLLKNFEKLPECPMEQSLMECYKNESKPLNCRNLVLGYISCVEDYTKKAMERLGAVSCVKQRPKPKFFHH